MPGAKAPNFKLTLDDGSTVSLADFKGKALVIYFFPRADTPGCTTEAMDFSRLKAAFTRANAVVLGVSADPVEAQEKFKKKHGLKVPLGADTTRKMIEDYGAWGERSLYGRKFMGIVRSTVLIGPDGKVAQVWPSVKVKGHAEAVLDAVKSL